MAKMNRPATFPSYIPVEPSSFSSDDKGDSLGWCSRNVWPVHSGDFVHSCSMVISETLPKLTLWVAGTERESVCIMHIGDWQVGGPGGKGVILANHTYGLCLLFFLFVLWFRIWQIVILPSKCCPLKQKAKCQIQTWNPAIFVGPFLPLGSPPFRARLCLWSSAKWQIWWPRCISPPYLKCRNECLVLAHDISSHIPPANHGRVWVTRDQSSPFLCWGRRLGRERENEVYFYFT